MGRKFPSTYLLLPRSGWLGSKERKAVMLDLPELRRPPPRLVTTTPDGVMRTFQCVTRWRLGFIYMELAEG